MAAAAPAAAADTAAAALVAGCTQPRAAGHSQGDTAGVDIPAVAVVHTPAAVVHSPAAVVHHSPAVGSQHQLVGSPSQRAVGPYHVARSHTQEAAARHRLRVGVAPPSHLNTHRSLA